MESPNNWRFCDTASDYKDLFEIIDQMTDQDKRVHLMRIHGAAPGVIPTPAGYYAFSTRASEDRKTMHDTLPHMVVADHFKIYSHVSASLGVIIEVVAEVRSPLPA